MTQPRFFAAFGKTDYFKSTRGRMGFWDFFGRGIKPYGFLFSLAYKQAIFPEPDVPIFGDCGAPKYRYEDSPTIGNQPVTASWAADEYRSRIVHHREKYIVAPDHILMEGLSHKQLEQRREFNWTQARDFLSLVKDWSNTTAIAVAHGVTIRERIHAAHCLLELGYEAIGLGGLVGIGGVRHTLEVIKAIADALPKEIYIHVFGLCSPQFIRGFAELGISSFDGSTHLRGGFKGNFFEAVGKRLVRHKCDAERILIPKCYCHQCEALSELNIEPRLKNNRQNNLGRVLHNLGALARSHRNATLKRQIVLVACVSKKLDRPAPAIELYCSQWFRAACKYALSTGWELYFLSAQHGLVRPSQVLDPYECNPRKKTKIELLQWQTMVVNQLKELAPDGAQFAIIGGKSYYEGVKEKLEEQELYTVATPLIGKMIGWQLNWLKVNTPKYQQLSLTLNCCA
jgi:hypothetical protein